MFRSQRLPGLWLDEAAFWRGDLSAVLSRLRDGMESAAYKMFLKSSNGLKPSDD